MSYEQLWEDFFVSTVKNILAKTGYPARNLCLEITERCRLIDVKRLTAIVSELRSIGVSSIQGYYFSKPIPVETFYEKYVTE